MSTHADVYGRKRTTPRKAVSRIRNGDTIVHGLTIAEPPALLIAIAHPKFRQSLFNEAEKLYPV